MRMDKSVIEQRQGEEKPYYSTAKRLIGRYMQCRVAELQEMGQKHGLEPSVGRFPMTRGPVGGGGALPGAHCHDSPERCVEKLSQTCGCAQGHTAGKWHRWSLKHPSVRLCALLGERAMQCFLGQSGHMLAVRCGSASGAPAGVQRG